MGNNRYQFLEWSKRMVKVIYSLLWIYFAIIFIGAIYFYLLSKDLRGVTKYEYVIAIIIPSWSGAEYLSIALG